MLQEFNIIFYYDNKTTFFFTKDHAMVIMSNFRNNWLYNTEQSYFNPNNPNNK